MLQQMELLDRMGARNYANKYSMIFTIYSKKRLLVTWHMRHSDTTQCTYIEHESIETNNYTIGLHNTTNNQLYITMYPYVRYDAPKGSKNRNNSFNIARRCHFNNDNNHGDRIVN